MRARNIKPDFFSDDELGELDPVVRLLFAGLWCVADRDGRMKDRPKKLKVLIFPYDDIDVNPLLDTLSPKFITRYQVNGCRYIEVNNFTKHQNPHPKEKSYDYPAPPEKPSNYTASPVISRPIGMNDESCLLNDERGMTQSGTDYEADFEEWWSKYPNKQGKDRARGHYERRRKAGQSRESLLKARDRYACSKQADHNPKYSHGSTFLNPKPQSDFANINDWFAPSPDKPHTFSPEHIEKMLKMHRERLAYLETFVTDSSPMEDRQEVAQVREAIAELEAKDG